MVIDISFGLCSKQLSVATSDGWISCDIIWEQDPLMSNSPRPNIPTDQKYALQIFLILLLTARYGWRADLSSAPVTLSDPGSAQNKRLECLMSPVTSGSDQAWGGLTKNNLTSPSHPEVSLPRSNQNMLNPNILRLKTFHHTNWGGLNPLTVI